jgi:hypothetical protein
VIPVTLRNFGLSFSRRGARPYAGVSWRPRGVGLVTALIVIAVVLVALWAALAHAGEAEDKLLAQGIVAGNWPEFVRQRRVGASKQCAPAEFSVGNCVL